MRDTKDKGVVGGEKKGKRQQAGLSLLEPEHGAEREAMCCTAAIKVMILILQAYLAWGEYQ
jgi:hypothetical protein